MVEGGCLCGAIRYSFQLAPYGVGYCHCRLCQRSLRDAGFSMGCISPGSISLYP